MTDQEAFDILEGAIGMIEGEWGEGDGSEGSALSHIRARLTTAETERDYQQAQADEWRDRAFAAKDVLKTANDNCERLDGERAAAEARVEALSEALRREVSKRFWRSDGQPKTHEARMQAMEP